jgi:hypothetical protein
MGSNHSQVNLGRHLFFFALALILFYGVAGLFAFPVADDLFFALIRAKGTWLEMSINEWSRWSGRYISNFIVIGSPLFLGGIALYKLMPMLLLFFMVFTVRSIFVAFKVLNVGLFAGGFILVFLGGMPDITEGFFWFTGAWIYMPGVFFFMAATALFLRYKYQINNIKGIVWFTAMALYIVAGGFNEIMPIWALFFALFLFWKEKGGKASWFFLLFQLLILIVVFSAPGNRFRQDQFQENQLFFHSFGWSILYTFRFLLEWMLNPALWLWCFCLIQYSVSREKQPHPLFTNFWQMLILMIVPLFLAVFTPIWSTGILGQYRTVNQAYFLFLVFLSIAVYHQGSRFQNLVSVFPQKRAYFLLFLFFGFAWKNNFFLWKELFSGQLYQYHVEMQDRFTRLEHCAANECRLPELTVRPKTLFVYSLSEDPDHWMNRQYQEYFSSGRVYRMEPNGPKTPE